MTFIPLQRLTLEIIFSIALIGILSALAIREYGDTVKAVSILEAQSLAAHLKSDIYRSYALSGVWPQTEDLKVVKQYKNEFEAIDEITVFNGSITLTFNNKYKNLSNKKITFRKAEFKNKPGTPIIWLCGYQKIPNGMTVDMVNSTDIQKSILPVMCK